MPSLEKKIIFLTGASSGIGAALATTYAAQGAIPVLFARREDRLLALRDKIESSGGEALVCVGDVTVEEDLRTAVARALEKYGRIDTVYANAGFGVVGSIESISVKDYDRQFQTNIYGVLKTIYATIDALRSSRGKLALMGSVMGYISLPEAAPYAMSKFAVRALAESLWCELSGAGVSVTHIAPGFVRSEIQHVDNHGVFRDQKEAAVPDWLFMETDKAANQMVRAVERRKREIVVTGHGKFAVFFRKHFGGPLIWFVRLFGVKSRREPSSATA